MSHASDDEFLPDNRAVYQNLDDSDVDSERDMVVSSSTSAAHNNRSGDTSEPSHNDGNEREAAENDERAQNRSSNVSEPSHKDGNEAEAEPTDHQQRSSSRQSPEPSHKDGDGEEAEGMDAGTHVQSDWSAHTPTATRSSQSAEASFAPPKAALFSKVKIRPRTQTLGAQPPPPKKLVLKKKAPTIMLQPAHSKPAVTALRKDWIKATLPPFVPKVPKRKPAQPIVELAAAQELRSVQKLIRAVQKKWREYLATPAARKKYEGKGPPCC